MASLSNPEIYCVNNDDPLVLVHSKVKITGLNLQAVHNLPEGLDVGWVESLDESTGLYNVRIGIKNFLLDGSNLTIIRLDPNSEDNKDRVNNDAIIKDDYTITDFETGRRHRVMSCALMSCKNWGITKIKKMSSSTKKKKNLDEAMATDPGYMEVILQCNRCREAIYCSAKHQTEHWKYHKNVCKVAEQNQRIEKLYRTNLLMNYCLFETHRKFQKETSSDRIIIRLCVESVYELEQITCENLVKETQFRIQVNSIEAFQTLLEHSQANVPGGVEESPYLLSLQNARTYRPSNQCVIVVELEDDKGLKVKTFVVDEIQTDLTKIQIVEAEIEKMMEQGVEFDEGGGKMQSSNENKKKPRKTKPNEKCPCGSGKKYKKCCGSRKKR